MLNLQKQQNGFALIGMLIAITIIAILFIYSGNTFFSGENNTTQKKAIYEETKKDIDEIEQQNQHLNDLKQKAMEDSENIEQIYNGKNEIINKK